MPNGDIVTGCSDGIVRVFSTREERWAPADQLKAYDGLVAAQALPAQQVGDVKKSDLPGPEALNEPGKLSEHVPLPFLFPAALGREVGLVLDSDSC